MSQDDEREREISKLHAGYGDASVDTPAPVAHPRPATRRAQRSRPGAGPSMRRRQTGSLPGLPQSSFSPATPAPDAAANGHRRHVEAVAEVLLSQPDAGQQRPHKHHKQQKHRSSNAAPR
ncbi:hypothetical protein G7Z17_g6502 [Cylindrodendrum hubeiense]|uniref:Uncharacterized protein n=1 Tax=Cylindrodendrum hubeiense TaxID=595255 RepID=A0A9P5HC84_9HYPO|nr:hypothetical protein G7Z17_g6502 [Cylindrodendrum hubeiense]